MLLDEINILNWWIFSKEVGFHNVDGPFSISMLPWPEQKTDFPWARRSSASKRTLGFVSVRVLKEDQNKCDMKLYEEILLWGLACVIMKAYKSMICHCSRKADGPEPSSEFLENKLQSSVSAGKRRWNQLKKSERIHLSAFILFVPQWMGCYWFTLQGHFCLLTWLIQTLSLPEMSQTHPEILSTNYQITLAQSGWYIRLTISDLNWNIGPFWVSSPSAAALQILELPEFHNHVSLSFK